MGTLQQIHQWSLTHHPRWLVVVRVMLGICLFVKGISFMVNVGFLEKVMQNTALANYADWLAIAITWAHLLGGFLIIIGLLTRWAILLQIPILLGAIIIVNMQQGLLSGGSELLFSAIVLVLLIFFLIEGAGPISLDNYFRKHPMLM